MCEKIKKKFPASCYFGKDNLPKGKKYWFKRPVEQCFCGKFWTHSFSGERMELTKEGSNFVNE